MSVLNSFGIYEGAITRANEICQIVLYKSGMDSRYDEMMNDALDYFHCIQLDNRTSITNALIDSMFNSTKYILMEKYTDLDVDYYINGYDSHLYINNMSADDFDFDELENGEEEEGE